MSKKNDFAKVFGGKSKLDFEVKSKKSKKTKKRKETDIFLNEKPKKKKKKHIDGDNIDKFLKKAINDKNDSDDLSELLVWENLDGLDIKCLSNLRELARGVFIVDIQINENDRYLIPIMITENNEILHADSAEKLEVALAKHINGTDEVTDVDITTIQDTIFITNNINHLYNINTNKVIDSITLFTDDEK